MATVVNVCRINRRCSVVGSPAGETGLHSFYFYGSLLADGRLTRRLGLNSDALCPSAPEQ